MKEYKLKYSMDQVSWVNNIINTDVTRSWRKFASENKELYNKYVLAGDLTLLDKIEVIDFLKLHINTRPRTLLDIGSGIGHFLTLLKTFHHTSVQGADTKEALDYMMMIHRHYGISMIEMDVKKQTKVDLSFKYNIITVLNPLFTDDWRHSDWEFFKNDLLEHITPGGELFIQTNNDTGFEKIEELRVPSYYFKKD